MPPKSPAYPYSLPTAFLNAMLLCHRFVAHGSMLEVTVNVRGVLHRGGSEPVSKSACKQGIFDIQPYFMVHELLAFLAALLDRCSAVASPPPPSACH